MRNKFEILFEQKRFDRGLYVLVPKAVKNESSKLTKFIYDQNYYYITIRHLQGTFGTFFLLSHLISMYH